MEVKQILKQSEGSTVIDIGVWVLVILIIFSAVFEYIRVQILAYNLKESFENAVKTVASENYNEVYAGFREGFKESIIIGGQFEGGPEGANNDEEEPEWYDINDYGDVEQELSELLAVDSLDTGDGTYSIKDIEIKINNACDSEYRRYEIIGNMEVVVPIRIVGVEIKATVPIRVNNVYDVMY